MLNFVSKLGRDTLFANTIRITHLADISHYISSEGEPLLLVQASDTFITNDRKLPVSSRMISAEKARALFHKPHDRLL